jgi:nucleoside 2-deoxyribosyltransferase
VYCAGPLFNLKEKEEMAEIAQAIEGRGLETFLPQRDGLEFTRCVERLMGQGLEFGPANSVVMRAIFCLDAYQVIEGCDAVVVNLNGRVPDEGAVVEAALAWSWGKTLAGYKADGRSTFHGEDNPMVTGLFGFAVCSSIQALADAVVDGLAKARGRARSVASREATVQCVQVGRQLWQTMKENPESDVLLQVLLSQCAPAGLSA